jgi:hypothetical protein
VVVAAVAFVCVASLLYIDASRGFSTWLWTLFVDFVCAASSLYINASRGLCTSL